MQNILLCEIVVENEYVEKKNVSLDNGCYTFINFVSHLSLYFYCRLIHVIGMDTIYISITTFGSKVKARNLSSIGE